MADSTGLRMRSRWWSSASFMESSTVASEGGLRFGSTMVSASYGPDGATEFGWRLFSGGVVVWIDVELTNAMCSWLNYRSEEMAFRIGVGPLMASGSLVLTDGGSGVLPWSCCEVVMLARSWLQVTLLLLVLVKFQVAAFGGLEAMAFWPNGFPLFFILRFQFCFPHYGYCLRFGCHGWGYFSLQVVAINQLVVGASADGGGTTVVSLLVRRRGSTDRRGISFPRWHVLLSAGCGFYYYIIVVLICSCFVFPTDVGPHVGVNYYDVGIGHCFWCVLSAIVRWCVRIKWLLPPSVRMKFRVIKLSYDFIWLHEEDELVNSLLCLCVGFISSLDSYYFKTVRVASGALSVFRRKLGHLYVSLRSLSLLLRLISYLVGVIMHEVRFMPPSVYIFC